MTIRIGRFGIDIQAGQVSSWDETGDRVDVSGTTVLVTDVQAYILRQQLLGYTDSPDELFVPVVWDEMPSIDGFYRVRSASVDARAQLNTYGHVKWSVQLERVSGFAAPMIESTCIGKTRAQTSVVRTNLLKNPSGRRTLTGYGSNNGALVLESGLDTYLSITNVTDPYLSIQAFTVGTDLTAGQVYTYSADIFASSPKVRLVATGAGVVGGSATVEITPSGAYARASVSFTAAGSGGVSILLTPGATRSIGQVVAFRDAMVELGPYLLPYFDGAFGTQQSTVNAWTGTPDNSKSTSTSTVPSLVSAGAPGSSRGLLAIDRNSGMAGLGNPAVLDVEGGTVKVITPVPVSSGQFDQSLVQSYVSPAKFYEAASTLTMGSALKVVTGRQISNTPSLWVLSNGLFRIRPSFGSGLAFEVSNWVSGAWSSWQLVSLSFKVSGGELPYVAPHSISVLRNGPEAVTIRLLMAQSIALLTSDRPITLDITLRRGHAFVSVEMQSVNTQDALVTAAGFAAAVPVNHGWVLPSTGAFLLFPKGTSGAPSSLSFSTGTAWSMGIGKSSLPLELSLWNYPMDPIQHYFWAGSESVNVVKR